MSGLTTTNGEINMRLFENKNILITGGTGSLGKTLTRRLLTGQLGNPRKIIIFSRDEAKQHEMRLAYQTKTVATDEIIYHNFENLVEFRIGDVRNFHSVAGVIKDSDIIFNTAALKQVPSCEYFPFEAIQTNILGPENIIRAIRETPNRVKTVIGISTDKACKPVNVMGMTKALQERVFLSANLSCPKTRFVCVRYGNVLASRGSVIPLFHSQIKAGGPLTITTSEMTRFLLSLDDAVDVIFAAAATARKGETYIPIVPSARVVDIAAVLIGRLSIKIQIIGIRPGEKVHEILISEEESHRTSRRGKYYVIQAILPEIANRTVRPGALTSEYSSQDDVLSVSALEKMLKMRKLLVADNPRYDGELLR
jgi:FlaA1/EpsC-like NDP-sugar epimerase